MCLGALGGLKESFSLAFFQNAPNDFELVLGQFVGDFSQVLTRVVGRKRNINAVETVLPNPRRCQIRQK